MRTPNSRPNSPHKPAGYTYGETPTAPFTLQDLNLLKDTLLWSEQDDQNLAELATILEPQLEEILDLWYGYVGARPHLLHYFHSRGEPSQLYLERVRARFKQWVLDLCRKPKDQTWLNYQWEIGKRHHLAKGQTDSIPDTPPFVHLRYMVAFIYPITATIRQFIERKVQNPEVVHRLMDSWFKAVVLTVVLWIHPYTRPEWW